jgi:hypothetical protein
VKTPLDDVMRSNHLDIAWLKHAYTDRFFADPFILDITETDIIILAEEYYFPSEKGRIARLTVDKDTYELKKTEVVLELDTHLSFPAIFRDGKDVYIYPENGEAGSLNLYKYDPDGKGVPCTLVRCLCGEALADAIIVHGFGHQGYKSYLFTTKLPYQKSIGKTLSVYKSDTWNEVYTLDHKIDFTENIARNAGNLFHYNGSWIRPAQICNDGYGKGLLFQELVFEADTFSLKDIKRIYPANRKKNKYYEGLHTFNLSEDKSIIVVDGYYIPFFNKIVKILIKIYSSLVWRNK